MELNQQGIDGLDLIELDASDNEKIFSVSFMKNLEVLKIMGKCGIGRDGIGDLCVYDLFAHGNDKIGNDMSTLIYEI